MLKLMEKKIKKIKKTIRYSNIDMRWFFHHVKVRIGKVIDIFQKHTKDKIKRCKPLKLFFLNFDYGNIHNQIITEVKYGKHIIIIRGYH